MTKKDPADEDDGRPKPLYPEPGVEEWELERALTHDGATYLVSLRHTFATTGAL